MTIFLSGNVDEVVNFLEYSGGGPRNVDEDYMESYVPVPCWAQARKEEIDQQPAT